jgi:pimeloyl-ACP methyl ester carboxylesterase
MAISNSDTCVVLAHAAWTDGSSWAKVIELLYSKGIKSIAPPLPFTTLSDDVRALDRALERLQGPLVLVGHAYSSAVVSATTNDRVRALVHLSGLAPAEGESVFEVFTREKPHPMAPQIAPGTDGFIWLPDDAFANAFAQNATPGEIAVLNAAQRAIALPCIQEKSPRTLWTNKPSWYLIAEEDRMIPHGTQRYLAERMKARTHTAKVDHVPMITAVDRVVALIQEALEAK